MKKVTVSLLLIGYAFLANAQNTVCFTVQSNPKIGITAFSGFTKYVSVLSCFEIYAEPSIPDSIVLHAAAVAAELLDNDEDGVVDDLLIKAELALSEAMMPIFSADGSASENTFFNNYMGNGVGAVLYLDEMDPSATGHWGLDATVEEIIHTINSKGHASVYPAAFSPNVGSSLMTAAMDVARGGQFLTIPTPYPASAWYHYDDATCNYECMAIEYFYWAEVTNMGILNDVATCNGIANEWEPCSPILFQSTDLLMYNLITDPQYKIPQNAPDGNYCPVALGIQDEIENVDFYLFPNPVSDELTVRLSENSDVTIFDTRGKLIRSYNKQNGDFKIDVSSIARGVYIVRVKNKVQKLIINK
jgi:hypothetical protein